MIRISRIEKAIENDIFDNKNIIIIGAGKDGKEACKKLMDRGVFVKFFVDENESKKNISYWGIEVRTSLDIDIKERDCFLLCIGAFTFLGNDEILQQNIVKKINIPSEQLIILDRSIAIEQAFKECLEQYKIDYSKDILNLNGIKIPNYLIGDEAEKRVFIMECCDLILPDIFNRFSEVDEGPYEFSISEDGADIVFDIGANIGVFAGTIADKVKKIYAFEPIPKSIGMLKKMKDLHANIVIVDRAVSNIDGIVEMSNSNNLGQNKLLIDETKEKNSIQVKCCTLDNFVKTNKITRIDLIKADIEGAERFMLEGARNVLKEFGPQLSLCTYHLDDDPAVLEKIIKEANPRYVVEHKYKKLYAYIK